MRHMDEGLLQAWIDGARGGLTDEERAAVEEHVALCPRCAGLAGELRASGDDVRGLLAAAARVEGEEMPAFDAVVTRARGLSAGRPRRRWRVAAGWAASVVVALGVGWLANEVARPPVERAASVGSGGSAADVAQAPAGAMAGTMARGEEAAAAPPAEANAAPARPPSPTTAADAPVPASPSPSRSMAKARVAEADDAGTLSGRVTDAGSGRPLESAQVYVPGTGVGTLTNANGGFDLPLGALPDSLRDVPVRVERLGYQPEERALPRAGGDTAAADFRMSARALALDEIVVTGTEAPQAAQPPRGAQAGAAGAERPPIVPPPGGEAVLWAPVSRSEAEAFVGFPLRTLTDLEVVSIEVARVGGTAVARVVQRLASGERLTLLEARSPVDVPGGGAEAHASLALDGGVFAAGRAPLPADSLRALLGRLR